MKTEGVYYCPHCNLWRWISDKDKIPEDRDNLIHRHWFSNAYLEQPPLHALDPIQVMQYAQLGDMTK